MNEWTPVSASALLSLLVLRYSSLVPPILISATTLLISTTVLVISATGLLF